MRLRMRPCRKGRLRPCGIGNDIRLGPSEVRRPRSGRVRAPWSHRATMMEPEQTGEVCRLVEQLIGWPRMGSIGDNSRADREVSRRPPIDAMHHSPNAIPALIDPVRRAIGTPIDSDAPSEGQPQPVVHAASRPRVVTTSPSMRTRTMQTVEIPCADCCW
jgi:hypothetical protein